MKYYAKINKDNIVENVIVVEDETLIQNGTFGDASSWKETWKREGEQLSGIRGAPASVGTIYDSAADKFYDPAPFASWNLNKNFEVWRWEPPIPYPDPKKPYLWDEPTESWILMGDNCCDDPNLRQ